MVKEKKKDIKNTMSDMWKATKSDFDSVMSETSKLIKKGEKHAKTFSKKSKDRLELVSAKLRRENFYYQLGKKVSSTAKSRWKDNKAIDKLRSDIAKLSKEIKRRESRK